MNAIICPHCKKNVEISEAFAHQFRDEVLKEVDGQHKKELEKIRLEAEERAAKRAKEEVEFKLKQSQQESDEIKERNKKLQEQLSELFKELRDLKQKDGERELEMKKQMLKERELMEKEVRQTEEEKFKLEKVEYEQKIEGMKKALEDAQRKAQQSSQQLQGEALELDLEQQLRTEFIHDEISAVPKGIDGADIIQRVKNKFGKSAGIIVWETKRTKAWSGSWSTKLREDVRTLNADTAILVSDVLPNSISTFGFYENIWVCSYRYAISLAFVLRISLLQVAQAKFAVANKDEKLEMLYQYLTNPSFKYRFEAQVESIAEMRSDLDQEQRAMNRLWKKRDMQIHRMMRNVASLYGELQGILGSALPSLPGLEVGGLSELDSEPRRPHPNPLLKGEGDQGNEKIDTDPQTLF